MLINQKKMKLLRYIQALLLCSVGFSGTLYAQDQTTVQLTTSATPFLRISPDARVSAMGDAGTALRQGANALFYNAAQNAFTDASAGIAVAYAPYLRDLADDMYLASVSGYYRTSDRDVISAGLRYFSLGSVPVADYNGNLLMTSNPRDFSFDMGYSRKLGDRFAIGVVGRHISSKLATGSINGVDLKAGSAVATDVSLYYNGLENERNGWTVGLSLSNLGTKIAYDSSSDRKSYIPANMNLGVSWTESSDEDNTFRLVADVGKSLVPKTEEGSQDYGIVESWMKSFGNPAIQVGFGAEYSFKEALRLRLGYSSKNYAAGNWQNLTTGIGLKIKGATLNFSYLVPMGDKISRSPLANTLCFGLAMDLGKQ